MTARKTPEETSAALARFMSQFITSRTMEKAVEAQRLVFEHGAAVQAEAVEVVAKLIDTVEEQLRRDATPLPEGEQRTVMLGASLVLVELARRLREEVVPSLASDSLGEG